MSKQIICKNATLGYEDGIVTENLNWAKTVREKVR